MSARQARFLTGSTMSHVVRMTMTGAMGITFVFLVDLANLFWISWLGEPMLVAAIGYAFAVQFFSVSTGVGLMIAATAMISRRIGMGEPDMARREATSSAIIAMLFQSTVALLIVLFRYPLLKLVGAEGQTLDLAARYLWMTVPSLSIMALGMVASASLRAMGDGYRAMFVTLTSGSVSMVVDPVLIIWMGLGLDGAAGGLVISRIVLCAMALRFAIGTHDLFARPSWWAVKQCARPYFAIAIPAIVTQMAAPFGNYLLTSVVAGFGDAAVAGWAVVNRLTVVAFGGIFSLSGAIGGIFGQNYGAKLYDRLHSTYRDALIFCTFYTLVAWALLAATSNLVIDGFKISGAGVDVYRAFSLIGAGAFLFSGALFVSNAAFNNLGKPTRSTVVNWLRDGVLILPVAWLFADWFDAPGAIYAQAVVAIAVGIFSALWGWRFVMRFGAGADPDLDLDTRRGYRDVNRFRRR